MRTFISLTLFLGACGTEYQYSDVEPEQVTSSDLVTFVDTDPAAENCGFTIINPVLEEEVEVQTYPVYELLSPREVIISSEMSVTIVVTISTKGHCGRIALNALEFLVEDVDDEAIWPFEVLESQEPGYATESWHSRDYGFVPPTVGFGSEGYEGVPLVYVLTDNTVHRVNDYPSLMATEYVQADEMLIFELEWVPSYVPPGSTVELSLAEVAWTDLATGTVVNSGAFATPEIVEATKMTVHIE